jgi:ribonuclease-3
MSRTSDKVEDAIGYTFNDIELLHRALTHASFGDGNKRVKTYERLEFLGDRGLGLLAAEFLFRRFRKAEEGKLAPVFNSLVDKTACERVARLFDLGAAVKLSPSEERIGGRNKASILADLTESVMAAVSISMAGWRQRAAFSNAGGPKRSPISR